jgi:hypothetical protein
LTDGYLGTVAKSHDLHLFCFFKKNVVDASDYCFMLYLLLCSSYDLHHRSVCFDYILKMIIKVIVIPLIV